MTETDTGTVGLKNKPKNYHELIILNNAGNISVFLNTQSQSLKELETKQPSEASLSEEEVSCSSTVTI